LLCILLSVLVPTTTVQAALAAAPARHEIAGSARILVQATDPERDETPAPDETPDPPTTDTEAPDPSEAAERARRERALDGLREANRSSKAAIFMSLVFPGWGQLYADVPFWGTVAFATQMYFVGSIVMELRRVERQSIRRDREEPGTTFRIARDEYVTEHRERARDFVWWSAAGFLIVALDAYVSVELAGFDDDDPPTPDLDREWTEGGESGDGVALRLNFDF
jgi:hypothetical protein